MKIFCSTLLLTFCCVSFKASAQTTQDKIKQFVQSDKNRMMDEYTSFVGIPDVSGDSENIPLNTAYIQKMMKQRGIKSELLHGTTAGVNAAVYGEIKVAGAKRTIAFYAHYDGQPVNAKQWANGLQPFKPVFITNPVEHGGTIVDYKQGQPLNDEWRLTGRASADDKAGVMTILNAYDALKKSGVPLVNNIKFFFEGEEEIGSPHLDEIFQNNKEKLHADVWIVVDGPRDVSGKKTIVFGARGYVNMSLEVYGAKRPLHSGNYGNWAPNPAMRLAKLLSGMQDDKGNVLINGFYDDVIPLTTEEKNAIAAIPDVGETLKKELGVAAPDGDGKPFLELLSMPSLNIRGIQSANTGELAAAIIPATAEAALDLRLVPGNDVQRQAQKLKDYIESKGYHIINHDPTDEERAQYGYLIKVETLSGYNAQRTSMSLPVAQSVFKAVQSTVDYPVLLKPMMGGSLPLYLFEKVLNTKPVVMPVVNYDNNQHAENENVQLKFLWEGIETMAAIMEME
jgi:acetylornithine deacetylase/succinyl-diaminopimelate desuccinylase-like protein